MGRLIAAMAAALAALGALAPSAQAHSVLIGTRPGNDSVVPESPGRVVLEFNEPVDPSLGSLRVFDGQGERVDAGDVSQPVETELAVGIDPELPPGTYTVAWRVVSADSHPISGAFVFHVVERGPTAAAVSIDALTGSPQAVDALFTASRFFELAFLLAAAGGSAALALVLPAASWQVRRRLYGVLAGLAGGLVLAAAANVLLQGATAVGLDLVDALSWGLFRAVLRTDYGEVMLIQAALAISLALAAMALRSSREHERLPLTGLTLVLAAALALTPSFAGHARTLGTLGLVSDLLHVVSAALWTGGLAFLVLALRLAGPDRWPLATRAVPRFSVLAVAAVVGLIEAGVVSAYLELETWSALWDNRYGLLVLAKIALVLPLIGLGVYNNRYAVPRLADGVASRLERRRFLRTVTVELGLMVAVVAVTAVLVSTQPARANRVAAGGPADLGTPGAAAPAQPFAGTVQLGDLQARVTVDPAVAGENTVRIELPTREGGKRPTEVSVAASLPSREIGPLEFAAKRDRAAPGTYVVEGASLSIAGDWTLRIEVLLGKFDLVTETTTVPIAPA